MSLKVADIEDLKKLTLLVKRYTAYKARIEKFDRPNVPIDRISINAHTILDDVTLYRDNDIILGGPNLNDINRRKIIDIVKSHLAHECKKLEDEVRIKYNLDITKIKEGDVRNLH